MVWRKFHGGAIVQKIIFQGEIIQRQLTKWAKDQGVIVLGRSLKGKVYGGQLSRGALFMGSSLREQNSRE